MLAPIYFILHPHQIFLLDIIPHTRSGFKKHHDSPDIRLFWHFGRLLWQCRFGHPANSHPDVRIHGHPDERKNNRTKTTNIFKGPTNMQTILVTGGTGYIGSHTVVELQQKGYEVIIIDNLSNSSADVIDSITKISGIKPTFEQFDLADASLTADFFNRYKNISGIIHFAAFKAVGESMSKPLEYYRNNLNSLLNILEGMKSNQIEHLVFSSSCTVYGQPDTLPVDEKAPIKPAWSAYGNTKQMCE